MSRQRQSRQQGPPDVLDVPAYTILEAAHHLRLPVTTVRDWLLGRTYPTSEGARRALPVIKIAGRKDHMLSFRNLVEVHVLSAIRREHKVRLREVRKAILYLKRQLGTEHPLADQQMSTDGTDLFIDQYGKLVAVSRDGQMAIREVLAEHLDRIERNPRGAAVRLFPFSGRPEARAVVIDPMLKFGRPCISGTGIPTDIIAGRFQAGDTIEEIAADYGRPATDIEEAIRFEKAA